MSLEPYADKWRAFGWNVIEVDGHDMEQLIDTIDNLPPVDSDQPTIVICDTDKGHGISFMQNNPDCYLGQVNEESRDKAIEELKETFKEKWGEEA